jgi:hypothetical protein
MKRIRVPVRIEERWWTRPKRVDIEDMRVPTVKRCRNESYIVVN